MRVLMSPRRRSELFEFVGMRGTRVRLAPFDQPVLHEACK